MDAYKTSEFRKDCANKWPNLGWSAPRAKFHVYRGRNVGIQPPKFYLKNLILAINLPLRGHSFAQFYKILRFYTRL